MTIGDKIYELRSSRNMSLREFAEVAGVTHTTIARLEADTLGTQKVYLDTLYQICKNLKYNFGDFLSEIGYLVTINANSSTVNGYSTDEIELIEKYRELNAPGKKLVKTVIDTHLATMAENKQNRNS